MEKILFLAHTQDDGALPKIALETLGAAVGLAKETSAELVAGLIGGNVTAAADAIGGCGATAVLGVSGPEFAVSRYASDAAAAAAIAKESGATIVIAPATPRFARALPGVAVRLGGRIETNVTGLASTNGAAEVQRWYYRQRMVATLSRAQRPWVLTIAPGSFEPYAGAPASASVTPVAVDLPAECLRTTIVGVEAASAGAQTIRPEAKLLFVAGAGWTKKQADGQPHVKEAADLILGIIDGAKASLGSSKSLVDQAGEGAEVLPFLSHLNQVGQTGATPRHPKGLATCCHGEEPHVVGWRFIKERRAVNLDPNCGWARGKADVLYVADAFAVIAAVNRMLKG